MKYNKITEEQFVLDCINKEFDIIGSKLYFETFKQLSDWSKDNKEWFSKYSFKSEVQYKEWERYFLSHIYDWQPKSLSKRRAKSEFEWFNLMYGFRNEW